MQRGSTEQLQQEHYIALARSIRKADQAGYQTLVAECRKPFPNLGDLKFSVFNILAKNQLLTIKNIKPEFIEAVIEEDRLYFSEKVQVQKPTQAESFKSKPDEDSGHYSSPTSGSHSPLPCSTSSPIFIGRNSPSRTSSPSASPSLSKGSLSPLSSSGNFSQLGRMSLYSHSDSQLPKLSRREPVQHEEKDGVFKRPRSVSTSTMYTESKKKEDAPQGNAMLYFIVQRSLDELQRDNFYLYNLLVLRCKDRSFVIGNEDLKKLQDMCLVDMTGSPHSAVRDLILPPLQRAVAGIKKL